MLTLTLHNDFMVNLAAAVHLQSKSLSSFFKQATECKSLIYCRRSLVVIRSIASFVWRTCSHMHHFQVAFLALPTLVHPGLFQSVVSAHLVRKVAISYMCLHAVCQKFSNQEYRVLKYGVRFISDHFFPVMVVLLCDCVVYEIYNYLLFF